LTDILLTYYKFFQSKYLSDRHITSAQNVIPVHARTPSIGVSINSLLQIIPHFNEALSAIGYSD